MTQRTRRRFLGAAATVGTILIAGCSGNNDDDGPVPQTDTETNTTDPSTSTPGNETTDTGDEAPPTTDVEAVVTGSTRQFAADWRNTGWIDGTPISTKPVEVWSRDVTDVDGLRGSGVVKPDDAIAYFITGEGSLLGVDLMDGSTAFEFQLGLFGGTTPAVHGDHVFVTGEIETKDYRGYASMRNQDNGERVWDTHFTQPPSGEVTAYENTMYTADSNGIVYASDTELGEEQWQATPSAPGPIVGAPAVSDTSVYFATESTLYCCNREDGVEQWSVESPEPVTGTPIVYGDYVIVQAAPVIGVFNAETGEEVWSEQVGETHAGVTVSNDTVLVVEEGSDASVYARNVLTGEQSWMVTTGTTVTGNQVVVGDAAYLPTETGVVSFSVETGQQNWRYAFDSPVTKDLVVADDLLLVPIDGSVHALTTPA